MASNRAARIAKAKAAKKASKLAGMANPGGESTYAQKKSGKRRPSYRLEGSMLLSTEYLRHLEMPGPFIVTIVEEAA